METSSSSESELESKVTLNKICKRPSKQCLICQKPLGVLVKGSEISLRTLEECSRIREHIIKENCAELRQTIKKIRHGENTELLIWHKNCYSSFTSKKNIEVLRKKAVKKNVKPEENLENENEQQFQAPSLRKASFKLSRCIFCQKRKDNQSLSQVMTTNIENKMKIISQKNFELLRKIGSNDLIGMEVKYHANCFNAAWKRYKKLCEKPSTITNSESTKERDFAFEKLSQELKKGFDKKKGFTVTSAYSRYLGLGGHKSKRQLLRILQDYFGDEVEVIKTKQSNESNIIMQKVTKAEAINSVIEESATSSYSPVLGNISELSQIHKICSDIRLSMDGVPEYNQYKNLDIKSYKKCIPENLFLLINLLVSDSDMQTETEVLSICQDIIFTYSKSKKLTPKHIALGIMVHQETKSKKIVEQLHACGHSISYKDVLRLRNTIAQEEISKFIENDNTVIPRQLVPSRFLQFAADNIDILEETLDKSPTFHGTQMAVFQKGPPNVRDEENLKLLPYSVKLDIPENLHLLRKINYKKSQRDDPCIVKKANLFSELDADKYHMRKHNLSWVLCRIMNADSNRECTVVPQWSGFNKLLEKEDNTITTYGYLPLLPYVASEYDTVWTVMKTCNNIANKLKIAHTVITFDQAIYFKAKEIQWLKENECKNYVIRLGGFHIMLNFLKVIGQHMEKSGLRDVWLESGLYGEATVTGILNGKKWNKSIRAHKLTYESLMRTLLLLFEKWLVDCKSDYIHSVNLARLVASDICDDIEKKRPLKCFNDIISAISKISEPFNEFIKSQSPTFKLWFSYIELVEILLEFLYAERTGNWKLHLSSFRKMIPWFFFYDHTNYSRWGSVYLTDMINLPNSAPEVFEEFMSGNFVIKRLPGIFNTISVDQALEHINKSSKNAGGVVGLTKNSTRLDEWFLSFNEIGLMVNTFMASLTTNSILDPVSQNIEIGTERIKVDEESVLKLQEQFNRFQVFCRDENHLLCISTNEIIDKTIETAILHASEKGEEALRDFVEIMDTSDFYKPLKKNNFHRLQLSQSKTQKKERKKDVEGQDFLQRVLAAREMGRDVNYSDIFKYELTQHPMALTVNGILATPSNKSTLGAIIESCTTSTEDLPEPNGTRTCHIMDGMAIVQSLGKPAKARTFGDFAKIFNTIVFKNPHNAERIDVVLDHYEEKSIKNCTRFKRSSETTSFINRIIDSPDVPLPQQWHLFIHSIFNKRQLTNFLSNSSLQHANLTEVHFVTSGGFDSILDYKSNFGLIDDLLKSDHEEADTRILLHILSAKKAGYIRCIIDCRDTDVLVLLSHFKNELTPEVWVKTGHHGNIRFIPVHDIRMDVSLLKNLPAFHALTGCDTTSKFNGIGKKNCWTIYVSHHHLLNGVGTQELNEELFNNMHDFVLKLYTKNSEISCIDDLRANMAVSKTIDKLPPTKNSLRQHCLRTYYQTYVWLHSLTPRPLLPNIQKYGWTIAEGKVTPIFQTQPILPENLTTILSTCGCKKDCSSKSCNCKKKNVCCIGSCRCMGLKSCHNATNKLTKHSIPEDTYSSSDTD